MTLYTYEDSYLVPAAGSFSKDAKFSVGELEETVQSLIRIESLKTEQHCLKQEHLIAGEKRLFKDLSICKL